MPTAKAGYYTKDGTRVPSVTTVLARWKDSGGLIHWAWDLGTQQIDYRKVRDAAADAGSIAHLMVENYTNGVEFDPSLYDKGLLSKAEGAFGAFKEWADQTNLKVVRTELGLVSEKYRYGGTLDAMMVNGRLALGDYKTSNAVYGEHCCQLAAYGQLWDENNPDNKITGGYHLLRFSKQEHPDDPVSFTHHYWSDLSVALKMFLLLREAYELDKRVKKMV